MQVAIVGGGLIGSSIAWRLAQQNFAVTVFDAGNLGGEASTAGAGMLSPEAEAEQQPELLNLGIESLRLYPAFIDELRAETGLDIEFNVCGCIVKEPSGSLFYPNDALVDPSALLLALQRAGQLRGIHSEQRHIATIEASNYSAVVISAGAWSSLLRVTYEGKPLDLPKSVPVKGHLIAFEMPHGSLGPILRQGHIYVLQRASGLVIAGSNEEQVGFDTTVNVETCEELHRRAAELVPELAATQPVRRWTGFRPGLEHKDGPILRRVPRTNVWLAYGHYRNGILLTPVSAQRIAAEIVLELATASART